jgi:3-hydroxybutyryl-CoA dehydratase
MKKIIAAPRSYEEISLGDYFEKTVFISEDLIKAFADLTEDYNPLHLDENYARETIFKKRIAHGLLPVSFIGAIFGTALPGPGSIYLYQNAEFKAPVFLGDTITVRAEVIRLEERIPKVTLQTTIRNQKGALVVDGEGAILFKPVKRAP